MDKKTLGILGLVAVVVLVGLFASGKFNKTADDQMAAGPSAVYYCSDSDGGINTAVKGTAERYRLKANGTHTGSTFYTDSCSGASVTEYSCSGSTVVTTPSACATGMACVNGACVTSSGGGGGGTTGDTVAPAASMFGFVGSPGVVNNIVVYSNTNDNAWKAAIQATDNGTIGPIKYFIDGVEVSPADIIYPPTSSQSSYYGVNLYTMAIENAIRLRGMGTHTVTAQVCDTSGNCTTTGNSITATVQQNTTKAN